MKPDLMQVLLTFKSRFFANNTKLTLLASKAFSSTKKVTSSEIRSDDPRLR